MQKMREDDDDEKIELFEVRRVYSLYVNDMDSKYYIPLE